MKAFTNPTKWVLTTALLAVLGFNVSSTSVRIGTIYSSDFASKKTKDRHGTFRMGKDQVMSVRYIDLSGGNVLALVSKTNTEGEICETCGVEQYTLSGSADISRLNSQVMEAISELKDGKPQEVSAKVSSGKEVRAGGAEGGELTPMEQPTALDRIKKQCERKSDETEILDCTKEKFLALLKTRAGKALDADDVLDFYKEEIEARLVKEMSEARRIQARATRSSLSQDAYMNFQDSDDFDREPNEMIESALNTIKDLLADTPEKFESVRRNLVRAETDILKYQGAEIKQTQQQAQANMGTQEGVYLSNESTRLLNQLESTRQMMATNTYNALADASSNGYISMELQSQYKRIYNEFNTDFVNSMNGNGTMFDGVVTYGGIDLSGRFANQGRGTVVVSDPLSGVSNRGVGALSTQNMAVIQAVDISGNTVLIPTTDTLKFGTPTAITPEMMALRDQMQVYRGQ